ncbi:hypothetical protein FUAX_16500 [Fulvitalea axinellae]|uniref:Helix-turn-helix domain-containing protein n=1 Tax=Fulvitalea axinellae TaxID=1182444 RepID=A0AAU9CZS8_9BACT|nr:hypothetical protein FUAX_16500 [Fulvitalea axinellae]
MRFLNLSSSTVNRLETLVRKSENYRVRQRAQAILFSARGYQRSQISDLLSVTTETVSSWFDQIEENEDWDLKDLPGRGRKPIIGEDNSKKI